MLTGSSARAVAASAHDAVLPISVHLLINDDCVRSCPPLYSLRLPLFPCGSLHSMVQIVKTALKLRPSVQRAWLLSMATHSLKLDLLNRVT